MSLINAITSATWAIEPQALAQIIGIVEDHASLSREEWAERLEAVEKQRGRPLSNDRKAVTVRDGVATIEVVGPIVRRADMFSQISGMTSIETLAKDFGAAMDDRTVHAIVLAVDSPGGEVTGVAEFADMIHAARSGPGAKPVVAYIGGLGASAGYWIASAAERVVCDSTALLGSIGVVQVVRDPSKSRDTSIEFVSSQSPRKWPDPTTGTGASQIQGVVDAMASVFVAAVARNRDVPEATVLADFGGGGLFVGGAAVAAGLADAVGSYESVLADLAAGRLPSRTPEKAPEKAPATNAFAAQQQTLAAHATRIDSAGAIATRAMTTRERGARRAMPNLAQMKERLMGAIASMEDESMSTNQQQHATDDEELQPIQSSTAQRLRQGDFAPLRAVQGETLVAAGRIEPDPRIAAMEARLAESEAKNKAQADQIFKINAARIQDQAVAFADGEMLAGRATPAEEEHLVALYAQAAHDDADRPAAALGEGASRVGHLKATQALRSPHGLTGERLADDTDAEDLARRAEGRTVKVLALPPTTHAAASGDENAPMSPERRKKLLDEDTTGRALREDEEKAEKTAQNRPSR